MQTQPPFTVEEGMDVAIDGTLISKVGKNLTLEAKETIDGSGKTLIPGNVCAHHRTTAHAPPCRRQAAACGRLHVSPIWPKPTT